MSFKIKNKKFINDNSYIKSFELLEDPISQNTLIRLNEFLSHNPLKHDLDPYNYRKLVCNLGSTSKKEVLSYLSNFVTNLGFQLIHEMQGEDHYRYFYSKEISLHLLVFNTKNKIRIESHIDVGIHKQTIQNHLTVIILSELHALLRKRFSTITAYVKYTTKLSFKKESPKLLI
ncbi:hypothetical protein LCGC14_1325030 [marine sediment metagenome]|uniref:Uncharacterized protein n=1 Tax=marine sediment metagenome TaxID=412755 RepID=A0A0F9KIH3_9ZZZZ